MDTNFIHVQKKVVKVTDADERLDAEYYVHTEKGFEYKLLTEVAKTLLEKIEGMRDTMASIQKSIIL